MKMKIRVLAVLALAILMINIAPVMRANAALQGDIRKTTMLKAEVDKIISDYDFLFVIDDITQGSNNYYFCNNYDITIDDSGTESIMLRNYGECQVWGNNCAMACGLIDFQTLSIKCTDIVAANININSKTTGVYSYTLLDYPEYVPPTVYSPDAPYIEYVNRGWYCSQFVDNKPDTSNNCFYQNYNVLNQQSNFNSQYLNVTYEVCVPSQKFVDKVNDAFMSGRDGLEELTNYAKGKKYPDWLKSLENNQSGLFKRYEVSFRLPIPDDSFKAKVSYDDIWNALREQCNFDLTEKYGLPKGTVYDIVSCYLAITRAYCIVYTEFDDSISYGNRVSLAWSAYTPEPVCIVGNSDPLVQGPSLPETDVTSALENSYKEQIDKLIAENEELRNSGLESGDVFDTFSSVSKGLAGLSGSFRSISTAVGNVFAFFPEEITGLLFAGFVACIIIAVYKALRG